MCLRPILEVVVGSCGFVSSFFPTCLDWRSEFCRFEEGSFFLFLLKSCFLFCCEFHVS